MSDDSLGVLRHWRCPDCGWIATTDDGIVAACCANHGRKCGPQMERFDPDRAEVLEAALTRVLASGVLWMRPDLQDVVLTALATPGGQ